MALRYKRFHTSRLLGWLALGVLLGLIVGETVTLQNDALWVMVALVFVLGGFRSARWWAVGVILIAGLILGTIRGSNETQRYAAYEELVGSSTQVTGKMSGDAQQAGSGQQRVTLTNVSIGGVGYVGEIFATLYSDAALKRGDKLVISGQVDEGFASYAASIRSGKLQSVERGNDIIRDIREQFAAVVRSVVVEPIASLGLGFVVGQRSTLPEELDEQLKIVGLTHIVVASGYNLTILARFVMRLLSRHSRYLALVGSLGVVFAFVLFSGFSPSMNRAVIVTVLSLLAWYVGRRFHPALLIGYVAAGTAFFNPMYVWSDLGWYLSFFAFAGILIVAPLVIHTLYRRRQASSFEQLVFETVSAEMVALPLIAFAFGVVPALGLIANVLVAPFIPVAMALTALTGVVAMVSSVLATIFALPMMLLIGYMVAIVEWLSSLPIAQYDVVVGFWALLIWYGVLIVGCIILQRRLHYDFNARDRELEV